MENSDRLKRIEEISKSSSHQSWKFYKADLEDYKTCDRCGYGKSVRTDICSRCVTGGRSG